MVFLADDTLTQSCVTMGASNFRIWVVANTNFTSKMEGADVLKNYIISTKKHILKSNHFTKLATL